jgi:hypothetical protein
MNLAYGDGKMSKDSEKVEELLAWKHEQEKQEAVEKATQGFVMLRCTTVLVSVWASMVGIGVWLSEHFNGVEAAVKAFIAAEYNK